MDDFNNKGITEQDNMNGLLNVYNNEIQCPYSNDDITEPREVMEGFKGKDFHISFVDKNVSKTYPPRPYITSTINSESPFPVSKTSKILQRLYQKGKITYIRTDSFNMSNAAKSMIKNYIDKINPDLVDTRKFHHGKSGIHECIRPTNINYDSSKLSNPDERRIYKMICKRSIIYMMKEEISNVYQYKIKVDDSEDYFSLKLKEIVSPGFKEYLGEVNDDSNLIKQINDGDKIDYVKIFTSKSLSRKDLLTEGKLITKLKNYGIGRPSTYSHIIENMKLKNYVKIGNVKEEKVKYEQIVLQKDKIKTKKEVSKLPPQKNRLMITDMGLMVNDFLEEKFSQIMKYEYSSELEGYLDKIEEGEITKNEVIKLLYTDLKNVLDELKSFVKTLKNVKEIEIEPEYPFTEIKVKHTRYGWKIVSKVPGLPKDLYTDFDDDLKTDIKSITKNDILDYLPIIKEYQGEIMVILDGHDGGKYIKYKNKNIPIPRNIKYKSSHTFREMDIEDLVKVIKL